MRSCFLRTTRLGFSAWSPGDLDLAVALWGDARVTRLIGGPFSGQWIADRLALEIATQERRGFSYWPIFRLSDGDLVGCAGLRPVPGREDALELGFHLRAEHWRQGYATEAARAVIAWAFADRGASLLVAGHHPDNDASRRTLLRLGFRYTGDVRYAPTGLDHPTYELTAAELDRALRPDETG
jgi:ribosomal-protein-alanine N-acetyltransferase